MMSDPQHGQKLRHYFAWINSWFSRIQSSHDLGAFWLKETLGCWTDGKCVAAPSNPKPKELCNLQYNAIAEYLKMMWNVRNGGSMVEEVQLRLLSAWWILEMEPSVKREELEKGLAFYRFSTDTQRKGRETCWTTSGLYLHHPSWLIDLEDWERLLSMEWLWELEMFVKSLFML